MGKVVSVASKLRRDRARWLRRDQTEAEARLWAALRGGRLEGWKWRRQARVGPFIVDFLCLEAALAMEIDGGIHAQQAHREARREAYLKARGLQVLRFWNTELGGDFERVRWKILSACRESIPRTEGDTSTAASEPWAIGSNAATVSSTCAALSQPLPRRSRVWERSNYPVAAPSSSVGKSVYPQAPPPR